MALASSNTPLINIDNPEFPFYVDQINQFSYYSMRVPFIKAVFLAFFCEMRLLSLSNAIDAQTAFSG